MTCPLGWVGGLCKRNVTQNILHLLLGVEGLTDCLARELEVHGPEDLLFVLFELGSHDQPTPVPISNSLILKKLRNILNFLFALMGISAIMCTSSGKRVMKR